MSDIDDDNAVDPNRLRYVFEDLLAHVLEGKVEFSRYILLYSCRDADPPWVGETFETRSNIHGIAKNVPVIGDDIADVYSNPELDGVGRGAGTTLGHTALPFGRATQRINNTAKLNEQPVTGGLDNPAVVLSDLRVYQFGP